MMRKYLDGQLFKPQPVMEALDDAMVVLFAFDRVHEVSFNLFLKFTLVIALKNQFRSDVVYLVCNQAESPCTNCGGSYIKNNM